MNVAITILILACSQCCLSMGFTPLEIDNHPCTPENLKRTHRYICNSIGDVLCQSGWKEPEDPNEVDKLNPCPIPVCNHNDKGCVHGECRSPDYCACEVGWEGVNCDICVPLPGCVHGTCDERPLECNCEDDWNGAYCDIPDCNTCDRDHGYCIQPNDCICFDGYIGENCTDCVPLPGCHETHGKCGDHPNTCECIGDWQGHLCDQPVCNSTCVHGVCVEGPEGADHFCVCESGWQGEACDKCVPYWNCPNQKEDACVHPNECICPEDIDDPEGLCKNKLLRFE